MNSGARPDHRSCLHCSTLFSGRIRSVNRNMRSTLLAWDKPLFRCSTYCTAYIKLYLVTTLLLLLHHALKTTTLFITFHYVATKLEPAQVRGHDKKLLHPPTAAFWGKTAHEASAVCRLWSMGSKGFYFCCSNILLSVLFCFIVFFPLLSFFLSLPVEAEFRRIGSPRSLVLHCWQFSALSDTFGTSE